MAYAKKYFNLLQQDKIKLIIIYNDPKANLT